MVLISNSLFAKKQRSLQLDEGMKALEAIVSHSKLIPVFRDCNCVHDGCGICNLADLPSEALIIELGCCDDVQKVALPKEDGVWKSRANEKKC